MQRRTVANYRRWGHPKDYYGVWDPASLGFNRTVPSPVSNGTVSNSIFPGANYWMKKYGLAPWFANQPLSGSIRGCPGEYHGLLHVEVHDNRSASCV